MAVSRAVSAALNAGTITETNGSFKEGKRTITLS
jgi:hypothetical protein